MSINKVYIYYWQALLGWKQDLQTCETANMLDMKFTPLFFFIEQDQIVKNESIRAEMIAPCLYGSILLVAGVLALLLPETNNLPLPVTIKEGEEIHGYRRKG